MKTLNTIQILSKIGKILSRISYICCLIGVIVCAVGLAGLPFADRGIFKIGGVTIYGLIANRTGIDLVCLYPAITGAIILCIGYVVLSKTAENYFTHELTAGTPFTKDGANEMLRLGILTVCIPLGCMLLAEIVSGIIAGFLNCNDVLKLENDGSVALGIMFIFMSLLCKYGAECKENSENNLH